MEFLPTISLTKAFPVAQIRPNLHKNRSQQLRRWKQFYAWLDKPVLQEMLLWYYTVGMNSILNFPAKIWTGMCRSLLCGDDSSHSQSQSGKRLLLASRGHQKRGLAYHGSCIDPTHLSHTLNLILKAPGARRTLAIRLLIKDDVSNYIRLFCCSHQRLAMKAEIWCGRNRSKGLFWAHTSGAIW